MRSIPALAEYCELIKKLAKPGVKVFNFTNPAGVVSQALRDMGYDFTYGICDAPSGMLHQFADLYGVDASRIYGECYGLNHLSYFQSIKVDGKEIMPELIANDEAYAKTDMRFFEKRLLEDRGCVLNEYLYYFYYREKAVANILNAKQTRGEMICDINRHMTEELSKIDIENDFEAGLKCFESGTASARTTTWPMRPVFTATSRGRSTCIPRTRAATQALRSSSSRLQPPAAWAR